MTDLRAIAERVLAIDPQDLNRESVCNGKAGSNITLDELEDARGLARAVLSSLDMPDDVREAMERFRKCRAPDTAVAKLAAWDTVYQGLHPDQNGRDLEAIISWALANPIRIDVEDCGDRHILVTRAAYRALKDELANLKMTLHELSEDDIQQAVQYVPDREQLLEAAENIESIETVNQLPCLMFHHTDAVVKFWEDINRLAAHTRRTLEK